MVSRPLKPEPSIPPTDNPHEVAGATSETEVVEKTSELLKPLLREPAQAPQAAQKVVSTLGMFAGPMPPPEILAGYDALIPGAAREILDMTKTEQRHRHAMERLTVLYPYLGLAAGFVALLLCVGGAVFLALEGEARIAALLLGAPLIVAIGWFVNGRLQAAGRRPASPSSANGTRR